MCAAWRLRRLPLFFPRRGRRAARFVFARLRSDACIYTGRGVGRADARTGNPGEPEQEGRTWRSPHPTAPIRVKAGSQTNRRSAQPLPRFCVHFPRASIEQWRICTGERGVSVFDRNACWVPVFARMTAAFVAPRRSVQRPSGATQWISGSGTVAPLSRKSKSQPSSAWPMWAMAMRP